MLPQVKPSTPLLVAPRLSAQGSMRGLVNPMAMPRADRIALANRSLQAEAEAEATAAEEEGKTIPAKFGQFNTFKRPGGRPVGSIVEEGKEEEEDGSGTLAATLAATVAFGCCCGFLYGCCCGCCFWLRYSSCCYSSCCYSSCCSSRPWAVVAVTVPACAWGMGVALA